MHCVRRDLLWPPLLPGSSILVGIHLSACATHTLHTHGDCKRAASIVAPLRQTQTDIFFNPPPLISLQCSSCKDGERERERKRKSERAREERNWLGIRTDSREANARALCIWILTFEVFWPEEDRADDHSFTTLTTSPVIDSRSGRKPWDLVVGSEGRSVFFF